MYVFMIRSFLHNYFQININLIKIYLPSIFYLQNAINLAVPLVSHGLTQLNLT